MGERPPPTNRTTSFHPPSPPPPGFRFYPSEQQLISHYLSSKNPNTNLNGTNIIQELNIYNFDPFRLPENNCFLYGRGGRRKHWFCYVRRGGGGGRGRVRRAGGGYWKRRGREREVVGGDVVGTRRRFVFYVGFGESEYDVKTDWVMYEYALIHHPKASFVLCRVFIESHNVNKLLEPSLSCCAENAATVRHVGIQCDGTDESAIAEAKVDDEFLLNYDNGGSNFSRRLISELEGSLNNAFSAQELLAIFEDDFLELDDLVSPLPGID